ncbi:MAG: short-chain dehydrogenase [Salinivirgaceae bacterium]|nr:MAG: short-chain dehydrogenase [Salinivirgaceae bacterium]
MTFKIESIENKSGRIAIVTGANIGLGYETALALSKTGMKVVMACRNMQKAEKAKEEILQKVPKADLEIIQLNLSSLKSVREFAETYISKYDHLDLLINNAGIMVPPFSKTEDGFESQIGVNYFAHFLLTNLLFPIIDKTPNSRIVQLSSIAHEKGVIEFDNLNSEKSYAKWPAYQQSKLACLMFAIELQRRIDEAGSKVISMAAHPGVSPTNLAQHMPKFLLFIGMPLFLLMSHKPAKGALPTLRAALDENVKGGEYYGPKGRMKGKPVKVDPKPHAFDKEVAKKLWTVSEELTGKPFSLKQ